MVSPRETAAERYHASLVAAEIRGAARDLSDPDDAVRVIDHGSVLDDGNPDPKAITKAIGELLKAKPYLAAKGTKAGPLPAAEAAESRAGRP